jgi:hypothetical protein
MRQHLWINAWNWLLPWGLRVRLYYWIFPRLGRKQEMLGRHSFWHDWFHLIDQ